MVQLLGPCGPPPISGPVRSEPEYPLQVDVVLVHGVNDFRDDPEGDYARLKVSSVLKEMFTGAAIRFDYMRTIDVSGSRDAVEGLPMVRRDGVWWWL
ncbi:hypothetical protein CTA2_3347 [Colletotrichum tanaceti]|uniref:Uncharacterized protein n=1 Tax=Colletotrichum tanaceti TaxID=1306861 RepID=A0A4U6X509_9PEZI|nr:hypothetical protein CTA2_3347 [Colletotrichum tanaceti]TKW50275.1 hypothetical protein CTA1_6006 [Colletotrichum tanaceti]